MTESPPQEAKSPEERLTYFGVDEEVLELVKWITEEDMLTMRFVLSLWDQFVKQALERHGQLTLRHVVHDIWQPTLKDIEKVNLRIKNGNLTFHEIDTLLSKFAGI